MDDLDLDIETLLRAGATQGETAHTLGCAHNRVVRVARTLGLSRRGRRPASVEQIKALQQQALSVGAMAAVLGCKRRWVQRLIARLAPETPHPAPAPARKART